MNLIGAFNRARHFISCGLLACAVVLVGYMQWGRVPIIKRRLVQGHQKQQDGRDFTCGRWYCYSFIHLAEKHVYGSEPVFYWIPQFLRDSTPTETRVVMLGYFLYPARIYYRNNGEIALCRYIICQKGVRYSLGSQLRKQGLHDAFSLVEENETTVIYRRISSPSGRNDSETGKGDR